MQTVNPQCVRKVDKTADFLCFYNKKVLTHYCICRIINMVTYDVARSM